MNFQAALAAANEAARALAGGVSTCPVEKTGLIVLVYGGDNDDALPNVRVTVDGNPMDTGANGLARFIPIVEGDHTVHVVRPDGSPELIAPDDEQVQVNRAECPIRALHMPTGVIPRIKLVWDHDDSPVAGVEFEIKKSGAPKRTTSDLGIATWDQRLRPYFYDIQAVFPGGVSYLVFDRGTATSRVDLSLPPPQTLKIKRSLVTFHVQKQVGAAVEELVDARVKLRDPEQERPTAIEVAKSVAKFVIPVGKPEQLKTCDVVSLTPDTTDAVYEVVEVTSV
ncbi:hypothetical protein [Pyxidicoccus trucidator]|uniref:hypothetical protein n=1 Tax=Pyxidicoccus trucidator TaxID=2709662 RepID=UPI0013DA6F08|nr:hypothetical protein [Pyxidicoccus trucidator]